jgi:TPR repeat protein
MADRVAAWRETNAMRVTEAKRLKEAKIASFQLQQASNGIGYAQYEIGLRYLNGNGVETNIGLARYWLTKSMSNGFPNAITNAPFDH